MRILIVDDGLIHPSLFARYYLRRTLHSLVNWQFDRISSLNAILARQMDQYQALVLYFHHKTISAPALAGLDAFVRQGCGVLAVHSAAASFKQEPHYYEILGGRFVSHGAVGQMKLEPTEMEGDILGHIPAFSIRDELYRHEYDPDNHIHFYTEVDGEKEPQVWTRSYGSGRVCYVAPGHLAGTMRHPSIQQILQGGLQWVSRSTSL